MKVGVGLPVQVKNIGFTGLFRLIFKPLVDEFPCFGAVAHSLIEKVKNIGFTRVFRLIFKPLVDEFPCFGAVAYSLIEKKDLDFTLKVVAGDISSIPGISDSIAETVRDAIEDSITWPIRQIIPILPGNYSDLKLKPCGTLDLKFMQAKKLTNKDLIGKSDPFVVLFVRPQRDRSKTIDNELNRIWNEHFEFTVEDASTQLLTVRVFDDEGPMQAPEIIRITQVPLKELEPGKAKDIWLKLVKDVEVQRDTKNRGQVHLELLYCPYGTESSHKNPFNSDFSLTKLEKSLKAESGRAEAGELGKTETQKKNDVIVRGVLSTTVIAAENLPKVHFMGKADPFVFFN